MKSSFINKTSKYKNIRSHINTLHYPVVYHTVLMTPDITQSVVHCFTLYTVCCSHMKKTLNPQMYLLHMQQKVMLSAVYFCKLHLHHSYGSN